jgi:hypothetical protein
LLFRETHYCELLGSCRGILRTLSRLMTLAATLCEHATDDSVFVDLPAAELANFLSEVFFCAKEKLGDNLIYAVSRERCR